MARKSQKPAEIVAKLRLVDALTPGADRPIVIWLKLCG
jgi:hypothetical protein